MITTKPATTFGERDNEFDLTLDYTRPPTGAMQARMYDPVIGRFLSVDPALEYSSPYTYVGNNPLRRTDPTGMYSREMSYEEMLLSGSQTALEFKHERNQFNENKTTTNDPDKNSKPTCSIGLNCGDAAAGLLATVELSSSQNAATSTAQRSVGYAAIGLARRGATFSGAIIGIYSLTRSLSGLT